MARKQGGDWLRYENPDDKLPWLEPADDYEARPALSRNRLIGGLFGVVAVIALLVGGMSWFLNRDTTPDGSGEAGLIQAPREPYKVPPAEPGGMIVEGQGDTVYAAGAGADPGGTIDLSALPEEPIARAMPGIEAGDVAIAALPPSNAAGVKPVVPAQTNLPKPVATAPKPALTTSAPKATPAGTATSKTVPITKSAAITTPAKPAPLPAAKLPVVLPPARTGNGTFGLQLGAFSTKAKAESAWKMLSGRFAFVGALDKSVEPVGKGDATLYRLRAVGIANRASADNLCGRMKVAGDSCTVVAP